MNQRCFAAGDFPGSFYFAPKAEGFPFRDPGGDIVSVRKFSGAEGRQTPARGQLHKMTVYRTAVPIHTILPVMAGFLELEQNPMFRWL